MKYIFAFLSLSSFLFAVPDEELSNETLRTPIKEENNQEVAFLEKDILSFPLPEKEIEAPLQTTPKIQTKSVWLTTGLSYLFPGLGHLYLNDLMTAGGLSGSYSVGLSAIKLNSSDDSFFFSSIVATQSIWSY